MVSALWKACSEGNLDSVLESLKSVSLDDLEVKDEHGSTPLIEAVKNGHTDIVRALLDRGANPTNASHEGLPEQYTSNPEILELLKNAQSKMPAFSVSPQESGYAQDLNMDPSKQYYPPHPGVYYYPGVPPMPEGAMAYYPPPPSASVTSEGVAAGGPGNLPPPDVARMIPCRYFPACRYGASCMFAHPQAPYFQGPLPPAAQYPIPYDPATQQPYPNYYAMMPPYAPPLTGAPMSPTSPSAGAQPGAPHPPMAHSRTNSEVVAPTQGHFSPPPAVPYGVVSPVSPTYAHAGPIPVPVAVPPLPLHHSAPVADGAQSPPVMYSNVPTNGANPPFHVRRDSVGQYAPQPFPTQGAPNDPNGALRSSPMHPQTQVDGYIPPAGSRETLGHHRPGSMRKQSFGGSRKPPCLFYPTGRCRNGDDCRFPHVLPDASGPQHFPHFSGGRGGHRPRLPSHVNPIATIEEKMSDMTVRDDAGDHSSRSQSTEPGRSRPHQGPKPVQGPGPRVEKKVALKQRLPGADEFPALAGNPTSPKRSPGLIGPNGFPGPTAAQILQAPAPVRKESSKESLATPAVEQERHAQTNKENKPITEVNGSSTNGTSINGTHDVHVNKLPISFAAIATGVPDAAKEVAVSA